MVRKSRDAAPHWNARYETFCIGVVAGMKKSDAYYAAGFGGHKGSQTDGPGQLLRRDDIRYRIRQLQAIQALRLNVTVESLAMEFVEAFELTKKDINPQAMVAATLSKAKILGFLDHRLPQDGNVPKTSTIPDHRNRDERRRLDCPVQAQTVVIASSLRRAVSDPYASSKHHTAGCYGAGKGAGENRSAQINFFKSIC